MAVILWHGLPGCGKSTKMREHVMATAASSGRAVIVANPARVPQWADLHFEEDVAEVIEAAWGRGEHVACAPSSEDLERLCAACRAGKDVILAIDELRPYASAHSAGDELVILARQHRWARCDLLMGTQSIGDVRTDLLAAVDTIHTGRVTSPRLLDYLKREYGLDPEMVTKLERGQFHPTKMGF